jgi:hypothetical protein
MVLAIKAVLRIHGNIIRMTSSNSGYLRYEGSQSKRTPANLTIAFGAGSVRDFGAFSGCDQGLSGLLFCLQIRNDVSLLTGLEGWSAGHQKIPITRIFATGGATS